MSDTEMGLDVADTLCFQLGGVRRRMTWRQFILALGLLICNKQHFDELNEDECFDPGGGEIDVSQNIEDDDSFAFVIQTFLPYRTYPVDSPLLLSTGSEDTFGPWHLNLEPGCISYGMGTFMIELKLCDSGYQQTKRFVEAPHAYPSFFFFSILKRL
ncbi:hypothetical protein Tco_0854015 [Tanacetum coccineum]